MVNYKSFNPVRTLSLKGRLLVGTIRFLYFIRKALGFPQWQTPIPSHHEDPRKSNWVEQLYLGYKYYYKGLVKAEAGTGLEAYFANQSLFINVPDTFIPGETISLSAGGDLIPYDCIKKEKCIHLWNEAGDYFFNNDLVFANLETVADMSKPYSAAPEVMLHDMYFNINEESFSIFSGNGQYKGYDVLSTANNHSMDFGISGILATQHFLQSKNIAYTGTSLSGETRDLFPILDRKGIKIAFLGYTYSLNKESLPQDQPWLCNHLNLNEDNPDLSLIIHQANIARQRGADFIVASLHMGCAYQAYPSRHIVDTMHRICDQSGIDLLIGSHPHNAQPMEVYTSKATENKPGKQHFIVYSLGDFIAYDIYKWCHLPLILKLQITKGKIGSATATLLTNIEVKPFYMYQDQQGNLLLKDFLPITNDPEKLISGSAAIKEVNELSDFFNRFLFTQKQAHVLS